MKTMRNWASHTLTAATRAAEEFARDRGHRLAAQIAYHVLFSLFPLALLVTAVLGLVFGDAEARERVVDFLRENIPLLERESASEITEALRGVTSGAPALGVGAAVVLVWSATAMMAATRDALNVAWDVDDRRPFFRGKLVDLLLVSLVGVMIAASLVLGVTGGIVFSLPTSFVAFLVLYRVVPSVQATVREVWPGALAAALLFEALKRAFGFYFDNFGSYNAVYGSLGAVAAFLFFVFLAANVLVYGAELASEWPAAARGEREDEEARPLGERMRRFARGLFVPQREQ